MSFTVYRSSAGSGKTYTLVKEYLGIVLKDPDHFRNVLAITFTNKAANEMRDRIVKSLKEIADADNYPETVAVKFMLPELLESSGMEINKLSMNAEVVLGKILHNYQDFSVGTIDSFIHRIIRTFAFDLHLPLNFEVETDDRTLVAMAVDLLLSRVGIEEMTTKILKKFTESRISDEKNWDIESDLRSFSRQLMKDDIAEFLPGLHGMDSKNILSISSKLQKQIKSFEDQLSNKAIALLEFWENKGVGEGDLFFGKAGIHGYISRLASKNFSSVKAGARIQKTLGEDKWYADSLAPERKALVDNVKEEMLDMAGDIISFIDSEYPGYIFYRLLKRNIFPLAILNEIEDVLDQIRAEEGIIHISEFDKRISDVVSKEPVPFIYERLGERYRHFLLDEFQDTSILEWQNILPLIENALAEAHFNMIVGDAKQAIYRFKGGEVEQLVELPKIYRKPSTADMDMRERQLEHFYDPRVLKSNFRSKREIIKFNNELYQFIAGQLPENLSRIYADCAQESDPKKTGGEVRISFVDTEGTKEDKEPTYFDQIHDLVMEMTSEKGYSLKDIAILCRSNGDASNIARNLLNHGIKVISTESLLLRSSAEVNFLIFCMDFISNNEDKVAMAGILTYITNRNDDAELHKILSRYLKSDGKLKDPAASAGFIQHLIDSGINFNPDELNQMGLYEKVESLIRIFSLDSCPDPYILFFLDIVYEYSTNKRLLSEDFMNYWRDNSSKYSIVVPEGLDAVNVMTIHKAKGLEFPVVIYPFANSKVDISKDKKWVHINDPELPGLKVALIPLINDLLETEYAALHKEETEKALLDILNILYVASTRPTQRLAIICDKEVAKSGEIKNIPSMLRTFLEYKDMWSEDKNLYVLGDQDQLADVVSIPEEILGLNEFISGDWRENILLSGNAAEYWDLEDDARNLEWGNLVHNILSGVETRNDLDTVIGNEIIKGSIQETEANDLKTLLLNIMGQEELRSFFDGSFKIKNEVGIMTRNGKEYRPDRLMINDSKAIVLDYKTGKEDPSHNRQIELYGELLSDMGYVDVDKYLLYIDEPYKLIKI